jgi:uncharacterized protein (DUF1684 family)
MPVSFPRSAALLFVALAAATLPACRRDAAPAAAPVSAEPAAAATAPVAVNTAISWEDEVAAWKQNRDARLRRDDGWLTLVGFAWLDEGENAVGSDPAAPVRLPEGKAPAKLGSLRRTGDQVSFTAAPGAAVTSGGAAVTTIEMLSDRTGTPTILDHGPIHFFVIERAGRLAVRIRDRDSDTLKQFPGLEYFPLDAAWKIEARFEPSPEPKELPIPNILGFDEMIRAPGHVVFAAQGKEHRLLALDDTGDGRLFLVFGDSTNGKETYGGGRFLYTDPPRDGRVIVDFNRAYNPPCVFTPYATCPLPPRGNRLPFAVTAGEKKYAHEAVHPETEGGKA